MLGLGRGRWTVAPETTINIDPSSYHIPQIASMNQLGVFLYSPLIGILVHRKVPPPLTPPPALNLPAPIYTPG